MRASFRYDKNNSLRLIVRQNGKSQMFDDQRRILEIFKEINRSKIEKVRIENGDIHFFEKKDKIGEETSEIVIYDYREFARHGMFKYLPRLTGRINEELQSRSIAEIAVARTKEFAKYHPKRIVATLALVAALSGLGVSVQKPVDPIISSDTTIETIADEETNEGEYTRENIASSGDDYTIVVEDPEEVIESEEPSIQQEETVEESTSSYSLGNATIDIDQTIDTEKQQYAYENYHETIEQLSAKWGISPNLPLAIMTQESGGYKKDNLMQIEFHAWEGQYITLYDFTANEYKRFLFSNTEKSNGNVTVITENDLKNEYTNLSIGIGLLRYGMDLDLTGDNLILGCLLYNQGYNNLKKIINAAAQSNGVSFDSIVADSDNTSFLDYASITGVGDSNYVSHVFDYLNGDSITIKCMSENGECVEKTLGVTLNKVL